MMDVKLYSGVINEVGALTSNYVKQSYLDEISRGVSGRNIGLPMGFERLSQYVCNLQRGRYDLWGGGTGTGKSAIIQMCYMTNPIRYLLQHPELNIRFKVKYFNMEMPTKNIIAKLHANYIFKKFGHRYSVNKIFSKGVILTADEQTILKDSMHFVEKLLQFVEFYESGDITPNYVFKVLMDEARNSGEFTTKISVPTQDGGTEVKEIPESELFEYKPNHPDSYTVVIFDHLGLIRPNKDDSGIKSAVDRLSSMLVRFRNSCEFSPVAVSQFNRSIEGMDRKQQKHPDPQLSDFKDTGNPAQDCDTAITLFSPERHRLETHRGYFMDDWQGSYRGLSVLKNRDGRDNLDIGLGFIGSIGEVFELPKVDDLEANPNVKSMFVNKIKLFQ